MSKQGLSPGQSFVDDIEWQDQSQSQEVFYDSKDQYPLLRLHDRLGKVLCPLDIENIRDSAAGSGHNTMASSVATDSRNFDSRVVKVQLTTEREFGTQVTGSQTKNRRGLGGFPKESLDTNTDRLLAFRIPEESHFFNIPESETKHIKEKPPKLEYSFNEVDGDKVADKENQN